MQRCSAPVSAGIPMACILVGQGVDEVDDRAGAVQKSLLSSASPELMQNSKKPSVMKALSASMRLHMMVLLRSCRQTALNYTNMENVVGATPGADR